MATFEWSALSARHDTLSDTCRTPTLHDCDAYQARIERSGSHTWISSGASARTTTLRRRSGAGRTAVGLSMGLAMRCCSMLDVFIMAIVCILKAICADVEGGGSLRVE